MFLRPDGRGVFEQSHWKAKQENSSAMRPALMALVHCCPWHLDSQWSINRVLKGYHSSIGNIFEPSLCSWQGTCIDVVNPHESSLREGILLLPSFEETDFFKSVLKTRRHLKQIHKVTQWLGNGLIRLWAQGYHLNGELAILTHAIDHQGETSLVVLWLRPYTPNGRGLGSILGWGTRFHVSQLWDYMLQLKDPACWN